MAPSTAEAGLIHEWASPDLVQDWLEPQDLALIWFDYHEEWFYHHGGDQEWYDHNGGDQEWYDHNGGDKEWYDHHGGDQEWYDHNGSDPDWPDPLVSDPEWADPAWPDPLGSDPDWAQLPVLPEEAELDTLGFDVSEFFVFSAPYADGVGLHLNENPEESDLSLQP